MRAALAETKMLKVLPPMELRSAKKSPSSMSSTSPSPSDCAILCVFKKIQLTRLSGYCSFYNVTTGQGLNSNSNNRWQKYS